MSSRSKEKVSAALRRLFRGNYGALNNINNNNNNIVVDVGNDSASTPTTANANKIATKAGATSSTVVNCVPPPPADANGNAKEISTPGASASEGAHDAGADGAGAISKPSSKQTDQEALPRQNNKMAPLFKDSLLTMATCDTTSIRARRLMKEFREIQRNQSRQQNPIFTVDLVDDSLFEWHARLHVIDPDSKLAIDMTELNIPHILLHLVFPDNFPFAPPFMRVVEPRIERGFVMEGGAICMELLTPRGWASAYTVEAVIMQFAASVVKGQGRILRKARSCKDFSRRSAEESFRSLVKTHEKYGWVTPSLSDG